MAEFSFFPYYGEYKLNNSNLLEVVEISFVSSTLSVVNVSFTGVWERMSVKSSLLNVNNFLHSNYVFVCLIFLDVKICSTTSEFLKFSYKFYQFYYASIEVVLFGMQIFMIYINLKFENFITVNFQYCFPWFCLVWF